MSNVPVGNYNELKCRVEKTLKIEKSLSNIKNNVYLGYG